MTIDPRVLLALPLFSALPADELHLLAERMRPRQFAAGEMVLREGEQCDEFYIVVNGQVDIVKALGTPDERLLAVRPAGTLVGELSLFSPGGRHTASVLAHGPLEMLAMTRVDFDSLLARQPRLAYGLVQTLSLRLIESEQTTIRDLHSKNDDLAQALRALQAAQAQLVEKEKIEHELQLARRIQCSLLSTELPRLAGYELGALMQAMSAVGGDFYDFIDFPDGRLGLAIGDVSDHGVPAALFVTMTITLLRSAARREATPADVLRSVNRGLLEFNMSGMFVTVLYGVLDPRQREFTYARAGHEPPLLHVGAAPQLSGPPRGAEESGMWIVDRSAWGATGGQSAAKPVAPSRRRGKGTLPLRGTEGATPTNPPGKQAAAGEGPKVGFAGIEQALQSSASSFTQPPSTQGGVLHHLPPAGGSSFKRGQILGVVPDPELDVQQLPVPHNSVLLLYTDGAREAWDLTSNMFGEKGLRAALAEAAQQPAQTICDRIFERLAAHRGLAPQQDDITLVTVRA